MALSLLCGEGKWRFSILTLDACFKCLDSCDVPDFEHGTTYVPHRFTGDLYKDSETGANSIFSKLLLPLSKYNR